MIANGTFDLPPGKVANVVTHLEMLSPPDTSGATLPNGVTFRQITPDVAWYRDILFRVGAPWLWYFRQTMSDQELTAILSDPQVHFYTLSVDGRDEAILELDFRETDTCELAFFGLTPALIGTGVGRYLMAQAITLAWAAPIKRFYVHTCTFDSQQALGFYVRSGFVPFKQQIEVDDDPRLNGVLPRDCAPHVPLFG